MANALINQERGLYSARGVGRRPSGGPWQVEKKIRETADVITFVVKRIDDRLVKTSLPGQYVTVNMLMPDWVHQPRQSAHHVGVVPARASGGRTPGARGAGDGPPPATAVDTSVGYGRAGCVAAMNSSGFGRG